jgi:hypothetical protein
VQGVIGAQAVTPQHRTESTEGVCGVVDHALQFPTRPSTGSQEGSMALIRCSECGRSVSDKASSCVGCGAPLSQDRPDRQKVFNLVPEPDMRPPPSRQHLTWRAILSSAALVAGIIWSSVVTREGNSSNHPAAILAGLLVVAGLCSLIVTAIQFPWTRNK